MNVYNDTSSNFYVTGDIHGNFNDLLSMLKRYNMTDTSVLVAGDCGFGFVSVEGDKFACSKLKKYCEKNNVTVYFMRGNHDNPKYFQEGFSVGKRLLCIPDYTVVHSEPHGFNVVCVGGATSIDRSYRKEVYQKNLLWYMRYHNGNEQEALEEVFQNYWEDEAPVYDEQALNEIYDSGIRIGCVVTHTCPSFCEPVTKDGLDYWIKKDVDLEAVLDAERETMDKLSSWLWKHDSKPKKWLYGHFHYHNYCCLNDVEYIMLDMSRNGTCDFYELRELEENDTTAI
ncbi:MAG: metallophosphoesterase [Bacteroidales bacterium]|nr:metallophosphoesterase [Bacteroidales bacterium]